VPGGNLIGTKREKEEDKSTPISVKKRTRQTHLSNFAEKVAAAVSGPLAPIKEKEHE
jgi:hypothetical protein